MDDLELRTVTLRWPKRLDWTRHFRWQTESETWLSLLEKLLENEYQGYRLSVSHDTVHTSIEVIVIFATVDDAALFKLTHMR